MRFMQGATLAVALLGAAPAFAVPLLSEVYYDAVGVDDGQSFSCDLTHHGKQRRVHTLREPLQGVITAITPFNHPLNQVIHKVAPAIATNNRMVLKPTEKTPKLTRPGASTDGPSKARSALER